MSMMQKGARASQSALESRERGSGGRRKKKECPFAKAGIKEIDYKDVETLCKFITDRGKIIPRRISGVSAQNQKKLALAIKRARHVALLPFVARN